MIGSLIKGVLLALSVCAIYSKRTWKTSARKHNLDFGKRPLSEDHFRPGFTVSASLDGINQVSHLMIPGIFTYMKNLELDDVDFKGGKMYNITFSAFAPDDIENDIDFYLDESRNSISLKAKNIFSQMQGNFNYKSYLLKVDGIAYVNITDLEFDLELGLVTQTSPSGDLAPAFQLLRLDINVDPDNVQIRLEGGMVAKIASLFTEIFKTEILQSTIEGVKEEAHEIVDDQVNPDLNQYGTRTQCPSFQNMWFDFALLREPYVKDYIAVDINGTFFNTQDSRELVGPSVEIPYRDFSGKAFQMYLTDWTVSSFFRAWYVDSAETPVTDMLWKYLHYKLTTDHVGKAIPQIIEKYGEGEEVTVVTTDLVEPVVRFNEGSESMEASFEMSLEVKGEKTLVAKFTKLVLKGNGYNKDGRIYGKIEEPRVEKLEIIHTTLKGVSEDTLRKELRDYTKQMVDEANQALRDGMEIPQVWGLDFNDNQISYNNGFVQLELNIRKVEEMKKSDLDYDLIEELYKRAVAFFFQ